MRISYVILFFAIVLSACDESVSGTNSVPLLEVTKTPEVTNQVEPQELLVMTHDSFSVSQWVAEEFETDYNAKLTFLKSGDTGAALNRIILSKANPQADVFYGLDNTFLTRALDADIFEAYSSPALEDIPEEFQLDPQQRALPVDFGDVCINYDKSYFDANALSLPESLQDLTKPDYRARLVVENPATSSPGLAFLLATIAEFGDPGYLDFWVALRANEVAVVNDWETAYYTNFSGSSGQGGQPMVVSYNSSPAAEVVFAEQVIVESPTGAIIAPRTCFRQVEFVGILKGTHKRKLAENFVDFMLGQIFQEDMPLQMFVYPVNRKAKLPDVFVQNARVPEQAAVLDPEVIGANREAWIRAWNEVVLR